MTEDEFAAIARAEAERHINLKLSETDDPILAALLVRDRQKIISAYIEAALRLNAPTLRKEAAERARLYHSEPDASLH